MRREPRDQRSMPEIVLRAQPNDGAANQIDLYRSLGCRWRMGKQSAAWRLPLL